MPAFCVILLKVPGLSEDIKKAMKHYLQMDKLRGKNNNPRHFSTQELAISGRVSIYNLPDVLTLCIISYKVPKEYAQFKLTKCTVFLHSLFSSELQLKLISGNIFE